MSDDKLSLLENFTTEELLTFLAEKKSEEKVKIDVQDNVNFDRPAKKYLVPLGVGYCGMCGRPVKVDILKTIMKMVVELDEIDLEELVKKLVDMGVIDYE